MDEGGSPMTSRKPPGLEPPPIVVPKKSNSTEAATVMTTFRLGAAILAVGRELLASA